MHDFVDESLAEHGQFLFFKRSVGVELRLLSEDLSEKIVGEDKIIIRVMGQSYDGKTLNSFKIELTSEVDIFFNYVK